jgi:hypothetical protein
LQYEKEHTPEKLWQQINRTDGAVRHEKEWKQQQLMQRTVQKHVWCVRDACRFAWQE